MSSCCGVRNERAHAARRQRDFKMRNEFESGYAPVNGLKMYYELHGVAVATIRRSFCCMAAATR